MPKCSAYGCVMLLWCTAGMVWAEVQTKTVTYRDGDTTCVGYLAWDDAHREPRPGVLVLHEWWGLDEYAKKRARQLAELGYVALAADMYGEGKTVDHPQDAGAMAARVRANVQGWRRRAQAGLSTLKQQPPCNPQRVAVIGYCFGGATALQLAYSGAEIQAVATFHAALPTPSPEEARAIKPRILVCHGADDTFISAEAINKFRQALDDAHVMYEFLSIPGAVHSFTVPDADRHNVPGLKYHREADELSWKKMRELFAQTIDR
ncbi:MAG: dienelactone hydrolase [Planctomycetaceae bacterium]|nr:MAG: dienelactone hydrolase [Planctomycetaceae bacterium]